MAVFAISINFPAPLIQLDERRFVLELFHGPSLAFKDFGARFMAQLMRYFNTEKKDDLIILVATSGDTGGAVASGFYDTPGVKVVILYPSHKVSFLQEQQLTTLGKNITALEIDGTFDDCQAMVKKAFLDKELQSKIRLSSANSINIARLIPQTFYYFEAFKQLPESAYKTVFCVPSGNFGNLTAGLIAQKMGLPIAHFIAATNSNKVVPEYLRTGNYIPAETIPTISNAMDVGTPSNFDRMLDLYSSTWNTIKKNITGGSASEQETINELLSTYKKHTYILDPHGAVAKNVLEVFLEKNNNFRGVVLETAHPSKFIKIVESVIKDKIEIPKRLEVLRNKKKESIFMTSEYRHLKTFLKDRFV